MSDFDQLMTATIEHLQDEKARGVRFIEVGTDTLEHLKAGPLKREASVSLPKMPVDNFRPITQIRPVARAEGTPRNPGPGDSPKPAISREAKEKGLQELRDRAGVCQKCPNLAASRKNVVFGVGDMDAALMFVGEAPGADEEVQGEPFVGPAGQLLTKMIGAM
ncbi:MAG: uracil-DNA glycosylase, partial [Opitutaceae bacterium]|nr:uracil-DNA glycosylase [Verrucomicrobiales bacterium]